jgi:hypothetical protein
MPLNDELAQQRRRALAGGVPLHNPRRTGGTLPALVVPALPDLSAWDGATSPTAQEATEITDLLTYLRQLIIDLGQGADS